MSDQNLLEVRWVIYSDNRSYFFRLLRRVAIFRDTSKRLYIVPKYFVKAFIRVFIFILFCFMFMNGLTARILVVPPKAQKPLEATGNPRMGTLLNDREEVCCI